MSSAFVQLKITDKVYICLAKSLPQETHALHILQYETAPGTFGRVKPAAFALLILNDIAQFAAKSRVGSKRIFLETATRDLSATLCRGITRQVLATVPLRARLNGNPVVAGLPVPTDDLIS